MLRTLPRAIVAGLLLFVATTAVAQIDPALFQEMRWRMIGPFRGGRTVAAVGVRQQPNLFYIGVNNGGVWKSIDYGMIWTPIFDDQPSGSIGAIAVAPSDPNVIYVGSGEGLQRPDLSTGDGIYKSLDAGRTWQHLGLREGQQIATIVVDPRDANRLFVAVLGHPYGPNAERGIFRSTDGGRTFEKVLYKDENTGGMDVIFDPDDPQIVYADLWAARQGPWENAAFSGPGSGLYKSTDGGTTWRQLTKGLPTIADGLGRIGLDVSMTNRDRLYAIVGAPKLGGLYRSDDAGESWSLVNSDERLWGRDGDFNEVRVDPKNADVVYVANIVSWKSTDGGTTFRSFRGAPGGDDYHRFWINPEDPRIILLASDQGAVVTVNGGQTWSSWYNQPTAQFYHVNTDNAFPYRVCGGQQESGSACVQSRSDDGRITFREWHPVGVEEYGYAVPDPLDPDIVYGGKVSRYDRRTGQTQQVGPKPLRAGNAFRVLRTAPLVFSPADPHILYFGANTLWKTTTGGKTWTEISPDLTRKSWAIPSNVGIYASQAKPSQRGVIYALAPSPLDVNRIWAGTDDGLIHVTADGGATWKDVTPKDLVPWAKVSVMEASHFDARTAYAAINTFRLDDLRPHIYRTRDGGKSWTHVTSGIPEGGIINVVREDPKRKGLLFAGSEQTVYVSFDDGDHWQSLRLNLPPTSIRDLVIHEDDIAVGTHGRGFWILDDIEPLRQAAAAASSSGAFLFKPQRAWRFRWNKNPDTPLPPEEPAGQNPPDGAVIDYILAKDAAGPVTLEILDEAGKLVRRYSSEGAEHKGAPVAQIAAPQDEGQVPWYWIRPPQRLATTAGMHRFTWDLHYTPLPGARNRYPISATPHDTAPAYTSPWVQPGNYTVRLRAGGQTLTQPLVVRMDPRVKTSAEGLGTQLRLSKSMYDGAARAQGALASIDALRADVARLQKGAVAAEVVRSALEAFDRKAAGVAGDAPGGYGAPPATTVTLNSIGGSMRSLLSLLQEADVAPTTQAVDAVAAQQNAFDEVMGRWEALRGELPKLNATLEAAGFLPLVLRSGAADAAVADEED